MASGPGKYSQRTDGQPKAQLPDAAYGEQKTYQELQSGAPMAQASGNMAAAATPMPADLSGVTPMTAGSQFGNEPVTAGADMGAGPGMGILNLPQQTPISDKALAALAPMLPALELMATAPNATDEFRNFVREVFARS
jgi:hypothetical protein